MSNSQKTPFALSIQGLVQDSLDDRLQGLGQVLPCSIVKVEGAIVTVNFDINNAKFTPPPVRCASISSRYIRVPLQVGDLGICVAANARLGGVNGLGLGVAPLVDPSNLGGLVFLPIGNINWESVDPKANVLSAPNGAVIKTTDGTSTVTISKTGIVLNYNGASVEITSSGITFTAQGSVMTIASGGVNITGALTINGASYLSHIHSGVQPGAGTTGGVV
jgi:hypothetical protein